MFYYYGQDLWENKGYGDDARWSISSIALLL